MNNQSYIQQREAERQRISIATEAYMASGCKVDHVEILIRKAPKPMPRGAALRSMTSTPRKGSTACRS